MRFTHYVALGDSMSTDEYPTCDLLQLDAVPAELLPAGAAALFYRNRDDLWPEFAGTDLATLCPGIEAQHAGVGRRDDRGRADRGALAGRAR